MMMMMPLCGNKASESGKGGMKKNIIKSYLSHLPLKLQFSYS